MENSQFNTTVSALPDNFLRAVFLQLPVLERVQLRTVCEKWKRISDDCWKEVERVALYERWYGEECDSVQSKRGGKELEVHSSNSAFAMGIVERCAKFSKLFYDHRDFGFFSDNASMLPAMKLCCQLEELSTSVTSEEDDEHLAALLKGNPHIRQLDVTFYFEESSKYNCFRELRADELEKLKIHIASDDLEDSSEMFWNVTQAIQKSNVLKKLKMDVHSDRLLSTISYRDTLEKLVLWICHPIARNELISISKLPNLRKLRLSHMEDVGPLIRNKFLKSLSRHSVNLETIGLSPCTAVTDEGLLTLSSLSKLKSLSLGEALQITDKYLPRFSHIEELYITDSEINDRGVVALLRSAPRLTHLNLPRSNISSQTIIAAVDVAKSRTNNIPLTIPVSRENEDFFWDVRGDFPPLFKCN